MREAASTRRPPFATRRRRRVGCCAGSISSRAGGTIRGGGWRRSTTCCRGSRTRSTFGFGRSGSGTRRSPGAGRFAAAPRSALRGRWSPSASIMRGDQRRCRPRFGSVWATEGFPPSRLLKVGVVVEGEVSASLPELVLVGEGFEAFAWLGIWDLLGVGPPVDGGADDFVHRGMIALRLVPGTIGTTAPAQAPHDFRIAAGDPGARLGTTR